MDRWDVRRLIMPMTISMTMLVSMSMTISMTMLLTMSMTNVAMVWWMWMVRTVMVRRKYRNMRWMPVIWR